MGIKSAIKQVFKKRKSQPKIPGAFLPFDKGRELFPGAAQYKEQLHKRLRGE